MPTKLLDRGEYLTLELIGMEYIDQSITYDGSNLEYSGLLIGLVVENHSNETCEWYQDALEVIDTNGFTYVEDGSMMDLYQLGELIPGGWHKDLDSLKPNRKYRLLSYIKDFHSEVGTISFEKETRRVVKTKSINDRKQVERIDIDISHLTEDEMAGLPEIVDAINKYS